MSMARLRVLNIRKLDIQANVRYPDIMQIQDIQRLLRVGHGLVRWCDIRILHRPELIGRPFLNGSDKSREPWHAHHAHRSARNKAE
jgi:hypothetical protein